MTGVADKLAAKRRGRGFHPSVMRRQWPILVWLIALGGFLILVNRIQGGLTLSGVVMKNRLTVSAPFAGTIASLPYFTGDEVEAGTELVGFDEEPVRAALEVLEYELAADAQQMLREKARAVSNRQRLLQERERVRLETEAEHAVTLQQQAAVCAELEAVQVELERLAPLVEKRLADPVALADTQRLHERLLAECQAFPAILEAQQALIAWSREAPSPVQTLVLNAQREQAAAQLEWQLRQCKLTSDAAGTIGTVYVSQGQSVAAGTVLLDLIQHGSDRVLALLREERARDLSTGMEFTLHSSKNAGIKSTATLAAILPDVVGLDQAGLLIPSRVVRGRYVVFSITEPEKFLPGESVILRRGGGWTDWMDRMKGQ